MGAHVDKDFEKIRANALRKRPELSDRIKYCDTPGTSHVYNNEYVCVICERKKYDDDIVTDW